ncbi:MAG: hypothetical protein OEZ22_07685 [Spirochaetia bacterium]|nr:hypothetical protein [Spirochaetia bacterium]
MTSNSQKNLTQTFTSANGWYSLEYPRLWDFEIFDSIPSFFDPFEGHGALQVLSIKYSSKKPNSKIIEAYPFMAGKNIEDKMQIFLHAQSVESAIGSIKSFTLNNNKICAHEYSKEGHFFMVSIIEKNNICLLVLYNCPKEPPKEEASIITDIIKSIQIL